jgi:hypothetical protein
MLRKIGRLFVIKTRGEAYLIIFALATGAAQRGSVYLDQFPGTGGKLGVPGGRENTRLPALRARGAAGQGCGDVCLRRNACKQFARHCERSEAI